MKYDLHFWKNEKKEELDPEDEISRKALWLKYKRNEKRTRKK